MNAVLVVVATTLALVGVGALVVSEIESPECHGEPMPGLVASDRTHHYRLTLWDEQGGEAIRTCMYDTSGRKVFDQRLDASKPVAQYWDIHLPGVVDLWIVDGDRSRSGYLDNLHPYTNHERCTSHPELFYRHDAGGNYGISADCTYGPALPPREQAEQRLQSAGMMPLDDGPNLPGSGGTAAVAVGIGGLLVLGIHFRRPLQWAFIGLFTRILAPKVLDQSVRAEIHQLVQQEPGIRPTEIADRLELAAGQTVHHLRILTQAQALTLVRDGLARHYFVRGQYAPQRMRQIAALRSASVAKLHRALRDHPGAPLSTLANLGGLSKPRASRLARRLMEVGLARGERQGKNLRLYPLN